MWAEFQVLHDMINRRGNFMQKCLDTVQIKKNNGIKIQPQYLPASPPACICRYADTKFPSRFLQLTQVSRVLAWLSRIFALAMPLFLCINRQPTEFPLPFFPLCTQLLSALPQQGQEVNKWKNPELLHLSVYLSNTVQPQWVKDCCWRQQSAAPAFGFFWIYGFPVPSAGTELTRAWNPPAPLLSRCCSSQQMVQPQSTLPGWFLGIAKQILPAAKHLQNRSAPGVCSAGSPLGFPLFPLSCCDSVMDEAFFVTQQLNFYILRFWGFVFSAVIAVTLLRWGCKGTAGKISEQWKWNLKLQIKFALLYKSLKWPEKKEK